MVVVASRTGHHSNRKSWKCVTLQKLYFEVLRSKCMLLGFSRLYCQLKAVQMTSSHPILRHLANKPSVRLLTKRKSVFMRFCVWNNPELRCENHKKDNTEGIREEGKREVRALRPEAAKTFVFFILTYIRQLRERNWPSGSTSRACSFPLLLTS